MKEFGEFLRRSANTFSAASVVEGAAFCIYVQVKELSRGAELYDLRKKLFNEVFYLTDRKGETKKSYQVTEILIKKDKLKVKFCEKIYSQKGVIIKTRVKFQDLAILEKKLGRALY